MNKSYNDAMEKIQASQQFKEDTLQKLKREKYKRKEKVMTKKMMIGMAATLVLLVGIIGFQIPNTEDTVGVTFDLTDRIVVDPNAPAACVVANIEGTIVEVGEDGLSFKLDNGKWVFVTDDTEIGITTPTAAAKEEQLFEPTFRVGNMIAGFSENPDVDEIIAIAIYTNWNWDDPIR